MIYLMLFLEYFKIGLFAIGGGLATLPFLFSLSLRHPEWISFSDISTMVAVGESTPGPMGVNMATYCGMKVASFPGAVVTTLGLITPSILIILLIAGLLKHFKDNVWVKRAFYGLRAAVVALIAYAGVQVYRITLFEKTHLRIKETVFFLLLLACMMKWKKVHPIVWIAIAALVGIALGFPT